MILTIACADKFPWVQLTIKKQNFHKVKRSSRAEVPVRVKLLVRDWNIIRVTGHDNVVVREALEHNRDGLSQLLGFRLDRVVS
ncbi:hypothetical protein D3C85_1775170 [compost metagenome]